MKTILQTKRTKKWWLAMSPWKMFGVSLIIIALVFTLFTGSFRGLISDFFAPVLKVGNIFYGALGYIPKIFSDKNKLIIENQNLADQVNAGKIAAVDYEALKEENHKLREELKLKPAGDFVVATVIARAPQIPLDTLFLDRGENDSVKIGDLALSGERILIGKVVAVSRNTATVAANSSADAYSYGYVARTGEPIELKGSGGGTIEVSVPIDFDIKTDDKVMTYGHLNCLVAVVGAVDEDKSSGFKHVLMSLPVSLSKTGIVFISHINNE